MLLLRRCRGLASLAPTVRLLHHRRQGDCQKPTSPEWTACVAATVLGSVVGGCAAFGLVDGGWLEERFGRCRNAEPPPVALSLERFGEQPIEWQFCLGLYRLEQREVNGQPCWRHIEEPRLSLSRAPYGNGWFCHTTTRRAGQVAWHFAPSREQVVACWQLCRTVGAGLGRRSGVGAGGRALCFARRGRVWGCQGACESRARIGTSIGPGRPQAGRRMQANPRAGCVREVQPADGVRQGGVAAHGATHAMAGLHRPRLLERANRRCARPAEGLASFARRTVRRPVRELARLARTPRFYQVQRDRRYSSHQC